MHPVQEAPLFLCVQLHLLWFFCFNMTSTSSNLVVLTGVSSSTTLINGSASEQTSPKIYSESISRGKCSDSPNDVVFPLPNFDTAR